MTANSRFFIIRADASTLTVNGEQLAQMRQGGFIGPDDKVIPVSGEPIVASEPLPEKRASTPVPKRAEPAPFFGSFSPALDDIDTAPIDYKPKSSRFSDLDDIEIDQAFASATSRSLYQLEAEAGKDAISPSADSIIPPPPTMGAKSYSLRLGDGRVLGPFDQATIEAKIEDRSIDEKSEIAEFGSDQFGRLIEVPEFLVRYKRTHLQKPKSLEGLVHVNDAGLAPYLLSLAHQLKTGWVCVEIENRVLLASMAIGRILNVHTTGEKDEALEARLQKLLWADHGQAWFEEDILAASDRPENTEATVALCRRLTSAQGGFGADRLLRVLGDQTRLLQLCASSAWLVNQEELSELESQVLNEAARSSSIHAALHGFVENRVEEGDATHALYFCQIAGMISFLSEEQSESIHALCDQLLSSRFIDLLPISIETPDAEIVQALQALKNRVLAATKPLSIRDPLRQRMRERINEIYDLLLDPAERYAFFTARARDEDINENQALHKALKKEFLERSISHLFEKGAYAEALPNAEKFMRLAPEDPGAAAKYLYARFYAAASRPDQIKVIGEMKERVKKFGSNAEMCLALASANLEMRDFGETQKYLKKARKLSPDDARIDTLQGHFDAISAAETQVRGQGPVQLASIVWVTLVTLALVLVLWMLAVDLEMGRTESHDPYDSFVFIRASALLIAVGLGYGVLHRKGPLTFLRRFKSGLSLWMSFGAVVLGAVLGAMVGPFSVLNQEMSLDAFLLLVGSAVVARVYFSGFMAFDLFNSISNRWLAVIWVSLLNILYYGSFDEIVRSSSPLEMAIRLTVLFFGLSVPMTLIQSATKSVVAPMIFQVSFVITAKLMTLLGAENFFNWFGM